MRYLFVVSRMEKHISEPMRLTTPMANDLEDK
jgi:hypothetical protein